MFWLSGPRACEVLAQGWNPHTPLHWSEKPQPLDHQGNLSPTVFTAVPRIPNPRVHLQLLISSEHLPPKSCSLPSSPNSLHAELNLRPLHPSYLLSGWPQTLLGPPTRDLSFLLLPPSTHLLTVRFIATTPRKPGLLLIPSRAKPPALTAP